MRTSRLRRAFRLVPLLILAAAWPALLDAAVLTVTNCGDSGQATQVRQVVATAFAGDTVLLPACSIALGSSLTLSQDLTLSGAGAGVTILSGGGGASVVFVDVGAAVTLTGLSIQNGNAASGGGISNLGTTVLANAVVSGNTATTHAGIENQSGATLTLLNSAVTGNTAQQNGGGIGNFGVVTLINSTVSANTAPGLGGGIRNEGTLDVANSTIASNSAGTGGGIYNSTGGSVGLKNTIVANNAASIGPNCRALGPITSRGNNLDSGSSCGLSASGDLNNRNPLLGPLQDNGGRTPTLALQAGSPAIDAGGNVGCSATDQRGVLRPQHGQCDIGAFEAEVTFASGAFSISPTSGPYATTQSFDAVIFANALGRTITQTQAAFDGVDQSAALAACVIPGTLLTGGVTFRCPGLQGGFFAPGVHTFTVAVTLNDGSTMFDTVQWEILANSEP